jgi:hypothetical protein
MKMIEFFGGTDGLVQFLTIFILLMAIVGSSVKQWEDDMSK